MKEKVDGRSDNLISLFHTVAPASTSPSLAAVMMSPAATRDYIYDLLLFPCAWVFIYSFVPQPGRALPALSLARSLPTTELLLNGDNIMITPPRQRLGCRRRLLTMCSLLSTALVGAQGQREGRQGATIGCGNVRWRRSRYYKHSSSISSFPSHSLWLKAF